MSANLLDGLTPQLNNGTAEDGGTWHVKQTAGQADLLTWKISGQAALASDQTVHLGLSAKAASGSTGTLSLVVAYMDKAGNRNWAWTTWMSPTASWSRFEASATIPSGMTIYALTLSIPTGKKSPEAWVTAPTMSYGSPVCLASSAHTPYATQDHVSVTYATKASLKVTDESVKAEVSARAQTDRNVADLSSRLTQTANSLTSEISDRRSAISTVTGLANAAQSTADNAAKQANLYRIGQGAAGAVAKWIHLGTLTSNGDSSSATIAIVFGDGYNGGSYQNSALTITIKDGWQSTQSATGACGVTAMRENCDDALVDVLAQSARVYDVWVYAPWAYSEGRYSVSGNYAAWQHSGATQEDEPATSATQVKQDVAYRLADATKAQTMATENRSSIKQLSNSITSEVTQRTKTDQMVSDLSSKLTQTANSLTSEISDRRSAITTVTGLANTAKSTADSASEQTVELSSRLDQTATDITATIESKVQTVQQGVDGNTSDVKDLNDRLSDEIRTRKSFMRFSEESSDPTLTLGQTDSPAQVKLTNKQLQFLYLNTVVAYMSGDALLINNAKILQQLQLGGFAFVPRDNGNLAFKWVGGDS